jgi:hypothetical protein
VLVHRLQARSLNQIRWHSSGFKLMSHWWPARDVQVYGFSTENWRRSEEEVSALMALFDGALRDLCASAAEQDIRLHVIGDLSRLPSFLKSTVDRCAALAAPGGRRPVAGGTWGQATGGRGTGRLALGPAAHVGAASVAAVKSAARPAGPIV